MPEPKLSKRHWNLVHESAPLPYMTRAIRVNMGGQDVILHAPRYARKQRVDRFHMVEGFPRFVARYRMTKKGDIVTERVPKGKEPRAPDIRDAIPI